MTDSFRQKVEEILSEHLGHTAVDGANAPACLIHATDAILALFRDCVELEHECKCLPGQGDRWNRCEGCVKNECREEILKALGTNQPQGGL